MATPFSEPPADAIDPARVPQRTLAGGARMPAIGLGTFGSDLYTAGQISEAVIGAVEAGYRHIDCASVYGNEKEIGASFAKLFKAGVRREDLWVNSKVWNDMHAPEDVIASCEKTLGDLQLEYLDLYLVHWPFPNFHAPGCDVTSRNPDSKPYIHEQFMATWGAMERLVERGRVRHIGTSNVTIPKLELILRDGAIPPAVNEMELHPHFQQPELFQYCLDHAIAPIGYCPIGSPKRPERDRTPDDTVDIEDPVLVALAEKYGVHPALICIAWAVQRGQTPIPFSIHREKYIANLRAAVEIRLTGGEMQSIAGIDKNNRLIKGQVFLWKNGQEWTDLWDLDGTIAQ